MARRHSGHGVGSRPRRRWVRGLVVITAVAVAIVSAAPTVLVHTPLRDQPLALAFAGIDGSITSSAASWRWMGGVEYRDVVLRDRSGRAAVFVPRLALDRGLLRLACEPRSLGTMRFVDPEVLVEVRGDGSSLEDIIAPWLASTVRPQAIELEVVNGTVELVDTVHRVAWRLSDVIAAGSLQADGSLAGWTAAGRLRHSDGAAAVGNPRAAVPPPGVWRRWSWPRWRAEALPAPRPPLPLQPRRCRSTQAPRTVPPPRAPPAARGGTRPTKWRIGAPPRGLAQ